MGEWSEYFEDFPEENPANWVDGRFDPRTAAAQRANERRAVQDQARLNAEIARIVRRHSPASSASTVAK